MRILLLLLVFLFSLVEAYDCFTAGNILCFLLFCIIALISILVASFALNNNNKSMGKDKKHIHNEKM